MLDAVIRELRDGHGWTVRELSRKSGVSHTQVGRIESGEISKPSVETLNALARAFARNPQLLLIVAGHTKGEQARAVLRPMFREHAELVDAWGDWARLSVEEARELVRDPKASDERLQHLAAEVFVGPETEETVWAPEAEALVLPDDADPRLHALMSAWRYLSDARRNLILDYAQALHRLEDLEFQASSLAHDHELQLDAAAIQAPEASEAFGEGFLREQGFEGFVRVTALPPGATNVPDAPGVYAVVRRATEQPVFLTSSVGGHFKGKDPTVPVTHLGGRWVEGAATLYLGRASNLRQRLHSLARFGRGEPIGHWGGRFLWQLADHDQLLVAWQPTADQVNREAHLVGAFANTFGSLPFANINQPRGSVVV